MPKLFVVKDRGYLVEQTVEAVKIPGLVLTDGALVPAVTQLFLDGPVDSLKMPPEGVRRIGGAPRQVLVKGRLLAQRVTCPDPAGLFALGLPDLNDRRVRALAWMAISTSGLRGRHEQQGHPYTLMRRYEKSVSLSLSLTASSGRSPLKDLPFGPYPNYGAKALVERIPRRRLQWCSNGRAQPKDTS
jgi:hypothetical protein